MCFLCQITQSALCYFRLINSITYFGLSLYTSYLGGDDYINFFLSGVVEIPAYLLCIWVLNRFGRKRPLAICMLLAGIALICTCPLDKGNI